MIRLLVFTIVALWIVAPAALGAPYWIAYEGNDFPENEGWWRVHSGGGADRWIEDGSLVLDGSADLSINDVYGYNQFPIDPSNDEKFIAEWRFRIDEIVSGPDPGFAVFSDDSWAVGLSFSDDRILSGFEELSIPFAFEGYHEFSLVSGDMRHFQLIVDDMLLHEGDFVQVLSASQVRWGDGVQGGASLTRWDYVRFGVVPEISTSALINTSVLLFVLRRRS